MACVPSAVVIIGLEQTSYLVMENQITVEVCAIVTSGSLGSEVTVVFGTQGGSAVGKLV